MLTNQKTNKGENMEKDVQNLVDWLNNNYCTKRGWAIRHECTHVLIRHIAYVLTKSQ